MAYIHKTALNGIVPRNGVQCIFCIGDSLKKYLRAIEMRQEVEWRRNYNSDERTY